MSGKRSRDKGSKFERLIANELKVLFENACRGVGQTQKGSTCADVEGTPFWVECKHGKQPNIRAAFKQAIDARKDADDSRPILVVSRKDRGIVMASMELETLIELLKQ